MKIPFIRLTPRLIELYRWKGPRYFWLSASSGFEIWGQAFQNVASSPSGFHNLNLIGKLGIFLVTEPTQTYKKALWPAKNPKGFGDNQIRALTGSLFMQRGPSIEREPTDSSLGPFQLYLLAICRVGSGLSF